MDTQVMMIYEKIILGIVLLRPFLPALLLRVRFVDCLYQKHLEWVRFLVFMQIPGAQHKASHYSNTFRNEDCQNAF